MFKDFVNFVKDIYKTNDFIPLHEPRFIGNEKKYVADAIDSTYVSSVGAYVDKFENSIVDTTGAKYAVATVNGTAALHIALKLAGVTSGDEVITQSLTFIATCNAIRYCNAEPVFVDVDLKTLGLSAESLQIFLDEYCEIRDDGYCWNKKTNNTIRACLPMHTFGFPVDLDKINDICCRYNILLVEDAAESLGSKYKQQHTGTIGKLAALSFNGNKILTAGGGGVVLTNDEELAVYAKHITTSAKVPHKWEFVHNETGYNYRMPNLNAALVVAQLELLPNFIENKRQLADRYQKWGMNNDLKFVCEPKNTKSNYWLNTVLTKNKDEQLAMLEYTNNNGVMTRPVWLPMHKLSINSDCFWTHLNNTEWLAERLVNVPSSVILND
jgi:perosamine synthetase